MILIRHTVCIWRSCTYRLMSRCGPSFGRFAARTAPRIGALADVKAERWCRSPLIDASQNMQPLRPPASRGSTRRAGCTIEGRFMALHGSTKRMLSTTRPDLCLCWGFASIHSELCPSNPLGRPVRIDRLDHPRRVAYCYTTIRDISRYHTACANCDAVPDLAWADDDHRPSDPAVVPDTDRTGPFETAPAVPRFRRGRVVGRVE